MTLSELKEAMKLSKQFYIDAKEVEILFFDELTETIEVRYIKSGIVTFVTRSSLSESRVRTKTIEIGDNLILRYKEVGKVKD
ncbi:hypothetical protein NDS46_31745 (plasmid) [Paenibacillus thiaminolyticus]|uniref:hypothetical protein n=1 Tax=Paenibacillus thiaminolyticus TaxID=49283 RepID=UPI00232FDA42|nr:hypothetical protein [Paenibacillus thiaminolyticus]WCF11532.1 hypothetical protein NDS46_31745 [Paenibacillus thiaminolyticus]